MTSVADERGSELLPAHMREDYFTSMLDDILRESDEEKKEDGDLVSFEGTVSEQPDEEASQAAEQDKQ